MYQRPAPSDDDPLDGSLVMRETYVIVPDAVAHPRPLKSPTPADTALALPRLGAS
jgi:hypothetical protein